MMLLTSTVLALCSLPHVSAFYPYTLQNHEPPLHTRSLSLSPALSVRIPLVRFQKRSNQYAMVKAATPEGKNSLGVDQDGQDFSYFAALKFGTSTEPYYLLLDSAASSTWVMSSACTTEACDMHNSFGPTDSTSLKVSLIRELRLFLSTYHRGFDSKLKIFNLSFSGFQRSVFSRVWHWSSLWFSWD